MDAFCLNPQGQSAARKPRISLRVKFARSSSAALGKGAVYLEKHINRRCCVGSISALHMNGAKRVVLEHTQRGRDCFYRPAPFLCALHTFRSRTTLRSSRSCDA